MAREFIDGFEAGDLKLWDTIVGTPDIVVASTYGMDGAYCIYCNQVEGVQKILPAGAEKYFAVRCRHSSIGTSTVMFKFYKGSTVIGGVHRNGTTGYIDVYVGSTVVATGTHALVNNTVYLVEVRYKIANSPNGIIQVKVDGILDIDFSGDTQPGADTTMDLVTWGYVSSAATYTYLDNFIVDNANWIGDTKIQAIVPTGVGTSTQWAPSSGANWQCVDEKPASEADLNSSNTVGHLDTYAAGDLVGSIENVKCVQVQALAVKEGAPTPLNLQLAVKSGATTYLSTDKAVPATTSKALSKLWELDPATAAPWEITGVADAEIGMKAVA